MASASEGMGTKAEPVGEEDLVAMLENLIANNDVRQLLDQFNANVSEKESLIAGGESPEAQVADGRPFEFLDDDEEFQKKLADGGSNPSASVDQWARNRLNRFRACLGLDSSLPFEELPTPECVKLLCKFYERVAKVNGEMYPTYTLMGLYRAFNRMLRCQQEKRIMQTGTEEVLFNMRCAASFKSVNVACVLSMERSRNAGANKPRKKAAVVTLSTEEFILGHICTQITHPRGLHNRTFYYLEFRFTIHGGEELYKVLKGNFMFGEDENGEFVRYDERLSKNNKVGLDCYQDEHFSPPVTNYDQDVIATLCAMLLHLPPTAIYLFMQVIDHPRTIYWFSSSRTGEKTLANMLKNIHKECGLDADNVMNKSGRTTTVTRMAMVGVPAAIGQKITGHKTLDAYQRYERSMEAHVMAAQKLIADGSSFEEHLKVETKKFQEIVINGVPVVGQVEKKGGGSLKMKGVIKDGGPRMMEGIYIDGDGPGDVIDIGECDSKAVVKIEGPVVKTEGGDLKRKAAMCDEEDESKSVMKPPKILKINEMGTDSLKNALKEWDTWADQFDWKLLEAKVMEGRSINIKPMTAVFGHIENMKNCTVTINVQSLGSR